MRIISGQFKGHALVSFDAGHIRPTTDRVKESLFNIWRGEVEDRRVIDLFSGTGGLGLEAFSRGATSVTFVDQHPKSLSILKQNIAKLKITSGVEVISKDVFRFLKAARGEHFQPFDIILIDPPFTEKIADQVMQALSESALFHQNTLIAIESGRKEKMGEDYGPLYRYDFREFGDKFLSLFRVKENAIEPASESTAEQSEQE